VFNYPCDDEVPNSPQFAQHFQFLRNCIYPSAFPSSHIASSLRRIMMPVGAVAGPEIGARGYGRPIGKCETHTEEMWEVLPFHDVAAPILRCRRLDLRMIPASWMEEARNRSYDFGGITGRFQGPCLLKPVVSCKRFCLPHDPPRSSDVHSWWGNQTYFMMASRLQQLLEQRTRKGLGELRHFQNSLSQWKAGVVYADGCKETQLLPRTAMLNLKGYGLRRQQWWPVVFVKDQSNPQRVVALCQAQALSWSRPWSTDISRVVCCKAATQQMMGATCIGYAMTVQPSAAASAPPAHDPVHCTTVIIEEIPEDIPQPSSYDPEWTFLGDEVLEEF
jgi:hypothetical protein